MVDCGGGGRVRGWGLVGVVVEGRGGGVKSEETEQFVGKGINIIVAGSVGFGVESWEQGWLVH